MTQCNKRKRFQVGRYLIYIIILIQDKETYLST